MSIKNPNSFDLQTAALWGMDSRSDSDVAKDLGIPVSPEDYASHLESSRQVVAAAGANHAVAEVEPSPLRPASDNPKNSEFAAWSAVGPKQRTTNQLGVALVRKALEKRSKR